MKSCLIGLVLLFASSSVFATSEFGEKQFLKEEKAFESKKATKVRKKVSERKPTQNNKVQLVLDAGHDNVPFGRRGVLGTCGRSEIVYNDEIVAKLQKEFANDPRYNIALTREPGKDVTATLESHTDAKAKDFLYTDSAISKFDTDKNLMGRPLLANYFQCDAMISIHHDSVSSASLTCDKSLCTSDEEKSFQSGLFEHKKAAIELGEEPDHSCTKGDGDPQGGAKLVDEFAKQGLKTGYAFLVYSKDDPDKLYNKDVTKRKKDSIKLAYFIAREIEAKKGQIGGVERKPSNHHLFRKVEKFIDCKDCEAVDVKGFDKQGLTDQGIIHRPIAVLRHTRCPSILIEVGNISDTVDEGKVRPEKFQEEMSKVIKKGVDDYFINAGVFKKP